MIRNKPIKVNFYIQWIQIYENTKSFNISTIQGQVFELLVQDINDQVVTVVVTDDTASVPRSEYAKHHRTPYLRDKYSLNAFYLSTLEKQLGRQLHVRPMMYCHHHYHCRRRPRC